MKIAIAGTGYVGLSNAVLLSQHNDVTAVDVIPEKVDMVNRRKSPIADAYIEDYLKNKKLSLSLPPWTATVPTERQILSSLPRPPITMMPPAALIPGR